MRLVLSFAALFLSIIFVQLGSGTLSPLDALSGRAMGFSAREIGLLGSAHFLGFIAGCIATPAIMARVGHSRAFAAFAATGAISALLHPLFETATAWAILRIATGATVAGAYTVVESWLQAKATNENRGRVSSVYRFVDLTASLGAQVMIAGLEPASYVSYNIIACLLCLSLLPLVMTTAKPPPSPTTPKLRVLKAIRLSPMGAAGVVTVGLSTSSFRMVGPLYGDVNGLVPSQIGLFLAAAVLGGAMAQPVMGYFSDKYDRRKLLIVVSVLAFAACAFFVSRPEVQSFNELLTASFLFGACSFPLYSVSAAHANDYAEPDFVVELNASLVLMYGLGAVVSPLVASELIGRFGPSAMFAYIGAAHAGLMIFGLYRMTRRPLSGIKTPHTYRPRTSIVLEKLLGRRER
jgi:MFS family permease